ncbi:MAG TPA: carboxypeptidase-like regulatory domain-containing protein [Kofleriaceae bacterium]|jgi:hypothetical protein
MKRFLLLVCLAACGADKSGANPDGGPSMDGMGGCQVSISFDPAQPTAGESVRAIADVSGVAGVLSYSWSVQFEGSQLATTAEQPDGSQVSFATTDAGIYDVTLQVQASAFCPTADQPLDVRAPGANTTMFRVHITPSAAANMPPFERTIQVPGGGNWNLGTIALDPGVTSTSQVTGPSGGIPAYLRFAPSGTPDAVVEAFADPTGFVTVQLQGSAQTVLVVPTVPGVAPKRFDNWQPGSTTLALDAGTSLSGTVRDPSGTGIGGAAVQLVIDGVPSTLTTSAANGSFTVLASVAAGASVTVDVAPPATTGLPRLQATAVFPVASATPIDVHYAANLAVRDLGGTVVTRAGAPIASAQVAVVASLAAVGTVTVGGTSATGTGAVRLTAVADASGALPSLLAPAAPLSAVVTAATGDLAVASLDLTSGVPASIEAPAAQLVSTSAEDPTLAVLAGVVVEAEPAAALALANASLVRATTDAGGAASLSLASGGHYDLRFSDPAGRAAPIVVSDVTAGSIAGSYELLPAILLSGTVQVGSSASLTEGASVQVLCAACTGVERSRPIAETATDSTGDFSLAVPDPGTSGSGSGSM